ncbi:MAG: Sec63 [Chrysothrix sp. TS-e1954]|nr:MAG: Sec63 [Chrysothrix sp. TS-e1954]
MSRPAPVGPSGLPVVHGIELISVKRTLPDAMRTIFPYPFFNAMQSKCVPIVFHNDDNFVLSSPTGSGKTVILELAICRLMSQRGGSNHSTKIVYQAPTKSLCSERNRDWQTKFNALGLRVEELTGDTESASLKHVHSADIIITTPEKWDSLTRKWKDHRKLMELIKLFLIDEVHILKEDRGASLEAVVSRMKSTGNDVRFIALSATVPNSDDIAKWLGKNAHQQHIPAAREVFSEEFRPVKLQKHVIGMTSGGSNEFHFDGLCTQKSVERHTFLST